MTSYLLPYLGFTQLGVMDMQLVRMLTGPFISRLDGELFSSLASRPLLSVAS